MFVWLWYLGMLVPVIGLVQFGAQAEADRFTYLSQIGLSIALAWTVADAGRIGPRFHQFWAVAATCGLVMLVISAWRQTWYWHDSEALWIHTLACTSQNTTAHYNLGLALAGRGRRDEAIKHYRMALVFAEQQNEAGLVAAVTARLRPCEAGTSRPAPQQPSGH
jgi:tetratricopeptide (TPR) repeat protein